MMRILLLWIATLAFSRTALVQTSTPANATSTQTQTPSTTLPAFEIDVIFPCVNTTYNFTDYIPIVFAFQNLSAAAGLGPFTFLWGIIPYGTLSNPMPGGVLDDKCSMKISPENVTQFTNSNGSPYIFVNGTNTTKPRYEIFVQMGS